MEWWLTPAEATEAEVKEDTEGVGEGRRSGRRRHEEGGNRGQLER